MKKIINLYIISMFIIGCNDLEEENDFDSYYSSMDTRPREPLECRGTEIPCAGKCVDISHDNRNCGWCEETCNIAIGDFCNNYRCKNVSDFGFGIYPQGPRNYDIKRDLPRPAEVSTPNYNLK